MKKLSLILMSCLLAFASKAQTVVHGHINDGTGSPVSGQTVYATTDSVGSAAGYYGSGATSGTGDYSFTMSGVVATGTIVHVYTYCGGLALNTDTTMMSGSIIVDFTCGGGPATSYTIEGSIIKPGSTTWADNATVFVIDKVTDFSTGDITLTAVDTLHSDSTGYFYRSYATMPTTGTLLIKVALNALDPDYSSYIPTYWDSTTVWSTASIFSYDVMHPIYMMAGSYPGGPGFIGGSVLTGAGKGTSVGDPQEGSEVIITTATGTPVGYTYSDAAGHFSFSGLAYGTYELFGDAWGKDNPSFEVIISAGTPSVTNVEFDENSTSFMGHIAAAISNVSGTLSQITVGPNPATDFINLGNLDAISGSKEITLMGLNGSILFHAVVNDNTTVVPVSNVASGIYMLQLKTTAGSATYKVAK